ncbi:flagellar hook-length control protein FliK [Xanthobacter sp. 126]|uniref:flagellar hook-length control protein FliK n=1 Tax=Xanthobacter sp. 126 TaxID=1131814 RepID=UPI00045E8304|nr:flagellar hook-length control protein FliK [Xanthobacter sp. 126]
MRTADVALAAFALNPDTTTGREPLPQDGPPFGDLLSLMEDARPVPRREEEALREDATEPLPEPPPRPTEVGLDRLLARCERAAPERAGIGAAPARRGALILPQEARPIDAAETEAEPPADTHAPDTPQPAAMPLIVMPPAPVMAARDTPAADIAPRPQAMPAPVPLAAPTGSPDAPPPMQLVVLRQETHFAPVRTFTPPATAPLPLARADTQRPAATSEATGAPAADAPSPDLDPRENRMPVRPLPPRAAPDDTQSDPPQLRRIAPDQSRSPARPIAPVAEPPKLQPALKAEAAPTLPFASLAQVGRAIAAEVAQIDPAAAGAPARGAIETPESAAPTGPVRVLDIALSPETLGRVVVHMRLTPHGLTVRLKADNPATAELLAADKDHLSALLRSAGLPDLDLEVGGPVLSQLDAPVRSLAAMEAPPPQESADEGQGGGRGGNDPGRQGRNGRQDRTFPDDDAAPSFADEPRAGAG